MIKSKSWRRSATAIALLLVGCDQGSRVAQESKELQQARQAAPAVANNLEKDLGAAKAEVARLEHKLALARQGVTDEVIEQRGELRDALQRENKQVREEVQEALGAATKLNEDSERARTQLKQTQPGSVETNTRVAPASGEAQVERPQVNVPVERMQGVEPSQPAAPPPTGR